MHASVTYSRSDVLQKAKGEAKYDWKIERTNDQYFPPVEE